MMANALRKKVGYVNISPSKVSEGFCEKKLIDSITSKEELILALHLAMRETAQGPDVFELLGIPRRGAQLLWNEFMRDSL